MSAESNEANLSSRSSPGQQYPGIRGVLRLGVFFLTFVVCAFALDATITHGLRRIRTSKFGALNKVITGQADADIVISGSSRALNHYDSRVIASATGKQCFNIGMNASQIDFQLAVLKAYLKHNRRPGLVIQNLDLFSFETTRKGEIYDPGYYVPYLADEELYAGLRRIDPAVWKWKHIPLYGYSVEDMRFTWLSGLLGCIGVNPREDYFGGFNPRYQSWTEDFAQFRRHNSAGVTYRIESGGVEALTNLLQLCQANGIPVLLVYSPEFHEMHDLERNRQEIFARFHEIADRFSAPFWDYSTSPMCHGQKYFYNSQHLNAEGAAVFSEELSARLIKISFAGGEVSVSR